MIKLKMAVLAAILLGPSAAAYASKGWKMERTLPSVLCAQSIALVLLGYVLPFSVGVYAVAAVSAAAWVYAIVRMKSLRRALGFFNLPCLLFLISIPIIYEACAKRLYLSYDEHSHWGLIVKVIDLFNELPRAGRGAPMIMFTYPPAGAMIPSLVSTLFSYRDGIANFGFGVMIWGMMLGLLPENAKKEEKLGAPLLYLCMMMIFPLSILRLFSEPVIAILAALLIVRRRETGTAFDDVSDVLYAVMLAMMKNTGIVILAFMLIARLIMRPTKRELRSCVMMLVPAALAVAAYSVYCKVQGIAATASPSHFAENLQALFAGTLSETYMTIPQRLVSFFFEHKLSVAGVYTCYGFGTTATVYALLLALGGVYIFAAKDRREALRTFISIWVINLLYIVMIAASYFFFFEEWEVARLGEADRYLMLPALWTGLMFCALLLAQRDGAGRKPRAVCIVLLTLCFLPLSHPEMTYHTFVTKDYAYRTIWARDTTDKQTAFLKSHLPFGGDRARLFCMGTYDYISLQYTLCETADIGLLAESWAMAPWQGDCEAVRSEIDAGGHEYVFVGGLGASTEANSVFVAGVNGKTEESSVIDARYAPLTADGAPLQENALYSVSRGEEGILLSYMATMPETLE